MRESRAKRSVYVVADWKELGGPRLMGVLHSELLRGKEVFSFAYERAWLREGFAQILDPDLGLYSGLHFLKNDQTNFGLFLDSSPDRWGRPSLSQFQLAQK
jgi:serine/threonine-protein kinase HipA